MSVKLKILLTHCILCHQELVVVPWNTTCDLLFCADPECVRHDEPVGSLPVDPRHMDTVVCLLHTFNNEKDKKRKEDINKKLDQRWG